MMSPLQTGEKKKLNRKTKETEMNDKNKRKVNQQNFLRFQKREIVKEENNNEQERKRWLCYTEGRIKIQLQSEQTRGKSELRNKVNRKKKKKKRKL